jgi:hypothetical protein
VDLSVVFLEENGTSEECEDPTEDSTNEDHERSRRRSVSSPPDLDILRDKLNKLEELEMNTAELDIKVLDAMLDADEDEDVYAAEHFHIDEYQDKVRLSKAKINKVLNVLVPPVNPCPSVSTLSTIGEKRRTYKLPTIEIKRFSGYLKEWLGWWAQFEKIHEDEELHPTDKF